MLYYSIVYAIRPPAHSDGAPDGTRGAGVRAFAGAKTIPARRRPPLSSRESGTCAPPSKILRFRSVRRAACDASACTKHVAYARWPSPSSSLTILPSRCLTAVGALRPLICAEFVRCRRSSPRAVGFWGFGIQHIIFSRQRTNMFTISRPQKQTSQTAHASPRDLLAEETAQPQRQRVEYERRGAGRFPGGRDIIDELSATRVGT